MTLKFCFNTPDTSRNIPDRTNHIKEKIDNTQKNGSWILCVDIINECSKVIEKESLIRHNKVGKGINLEVCKWLNLHHADK